MSNHSYKIFTLYNLVLTNYNVLSIYYNMKSHTYIAFTARSAESTIKIIKHERKFFKSMDIVKMYLFIKTTSIHFSISKY